MTQPQTEWRGWYIADLTKSVVGWVHSQKRRIGKMPRESKMIVEWEMCSIPWQNKDRIEWVLQQGWKPFAVAGMEVWFRRKKPRIEVCDGT